VERESKGNARQRRARRATLGVAECDEVAGGNSERNVKVARSPWERVGVRELRSAVAVSPLLKGGASRRLTGVYPIRN
jgi:hypothetical protein